MSDRWSALPDSPLCRAAVDFARTVSEPFLFHHVMRSAIYATQIGERQRLDFDRELVCVAAVLHDLGLTGIAPVQTRFEIEGADAAKDFLAARGMPDEQVELVWTAIALHTTLEIPQRMRTEIALCQIGIVADLTNAGGGLPDDVVAEALETYPWLDLTDSLPQTLAALYRTNPQAAMSSAVADACEKVVVGFQRFNFFDHLARRAGVS